ncbi:replication stress response regulator SDE2 isoform X2 [Colossoma macropomum]|uniref:replication stress response regulator SDE2 isoform X2 n=1 Tax=Colossoma macropomum TaxID=42526 RepID=UPI001864B37E|nr:replication stress response regulator SDE2 isoform X2 [Colossoma macropomum]
MDVFVISPSFRFINLTVEHESTVGDLLDLLASKEGVSSLDCYVKNNGRISDHDHKLQAGAVYRLEPRLCGGKGGFGSMLRALGAQIEKTTNREACRDLSGRRLRDVNHEKEMAEWLKKQADREAEKEQRRLERIQRKLAEPKHYFTDTDYEQQCHDLSERLEDSVLKGMQASSSGLVQADEGPSRKRPATKNGHGTTKKKCFWTGVDGLDDVDSSDADSDEGEAVASSSTSVSASVSEASCSSQPTKVPTATSRGSKKPETQEQPSTSSSSSSSSPAACSPIPERAGEEEAGTEQVVEEEEAGTEQVVEEEEAGTGRVAEEEEAGTERVAEEEEAGTERVAEEEEAGTERSTKEENMQNGSDGQETEKAVLPKTEDAGASHICPADSTDTQAAQPASEGPLDLLSVNGVEDLEALGLERLKAELMQRGMKCGGTLQERAARLFSVRGLSPDQIDPALLAKPSKGKKK